MIVEASSSLSPIPPLLPFYPAKDFLLTVSRLHGVAAIAAGQIAACSAHFALLHVATCHADGYLQSVLSCSVLLSDLKLGRCSLPSGCLLSVTHVERCKGYNYLSLAWGNQMFELMTAHFCDLIGRHRFS